MRQIRELGFGALLYGCLYVRSARPRRNWRSGFCVAVAPYKGLTPLAPLTRLSPSPTGGFRRTFGNLPLSVKSNIVFYTRPFAGFPGRRSFFISGLKFERGDALEETLEKLRQEYEDAKVKEAQCRNQVNRLENRLTYKENRKRKERAHRLITKGAAIESIVPATKNLSEVDFYSLMEKVFALPEVTSVLSFSRNAGQA